MRAFRDVEKNAIDKEQKCLNVQVLAPRETQVKEEFSEALVVDPQFVELVHLGLSPLFSKSPPLLDFFSLLICQVFSFLFIGRALFRVTFFNRAQVLVFGLGLLSLLGFALNVNLPVLLSRLSG